MFDIGWEDFRAKMHAGIKEIEENIIKKWLNEIGYTDPVGYYRNNFDREIEIYATRVGVLIGKEGKDVNKLKRLLTEEFGGEWTVKFIEIRGGFIVN